MLKTSETAAARTTSASESADGVRLQGLGRLYPDGTGLHPTDLSIAPGEFVSVLGPSGCGKSTLLRCVAGLETPDAGNIRFGDTVVFDQASGVNLTPRKRRIGMVFQDLALWPHLTAFENVAFPLRVAGVRDVTAQVEAALDIVGLGAFAKKLPHQLSGGQQQRVAVARAIVGKPDVLLMDEPLSALDAALKVQLRGELRALTRDLGLTTIYVTHDQEEAMSLSDRIVVLSAGRVRQASSPEQLYTAPVDEFVARFVGTFNRLPGDDAARVRGVRPDRVHIAEGTGTLTGTVESLEYRGGSYLVSCSIPGVDVPWTVISARPLTIADVVHLHVDEADVIDVAAA